MTWVLTALVLAAMLVALAVWSVKVLREYERGVVFRLGHLRRLLGPGPYLLLPFVNHLVRVDLRVVTSPSRRRRSSPRSSTTRSR